MLSDYDDDVFEFRGSCSRFWRALVWTVAAGLLVWCVACAAGL